MRAAIITLYGLWNYGNRLQNYAVDAILRNKGFYPETLVLQKPQFRKNAKETLITIVDDVLGIRGPISRKHSRFRAFDRQIKKRSVNIDKGLSSISGSYELFVIGGDQIWNPNFASFQGCEFCHGVDKSKVICISPSFGVTALPADYAEMAKRELEPIKSISVREDSGRAIIRELLGRDVPVFPDPVMLVERDVWDKICTEHAPSAPPYAVAYFLGEQRDEADVACDCLSQQLGLEVVRLLDKRYPNNFASGPAEFVSLISHSEIVVTDSFHAVAFALMYGKRVLLLNRRGPVDMSSRFETLTRLFGLRRRTLEAMLPFVDELTYDASEVDDLMEQSREGFNMYLADSLSAMGLA